MLDAISPAGPAARPQVADPALLPVARSRPLPLPRRWAVRTSDLAAGAIGVGVLIVLMWVRHGGAGRARLAGRRPHRRRPAHGAPRHLPRAPPAGPHVAQPVPGPGGRAGPPGLAPPLARLRLRLADRRPRGADDRRLRPERGAQPRRPGPCLPPDLPLRPPRRGRAGPLPARCRHVPAGRPAPALVRDLVRPPPLRLPRDRPRLRPPARRRRRLPRRPGGRRLLGESLRRHRGTDPALPGRPAGRPRGAPPLRGGQRRRGGSGGGLDLRDRPQPGPPGRPGRPVLQPPPAHRRRLVAGPSVLALRRAERPLPALHRQGPRRLDRRPPAAAPAGHEGRPRGARTAS